MIKYNNQFEKIVNEISACIPDEWSNIWFYSEVLKDAQNIYFYFKSKSKNKLIQCMEISDEYNVDEDDIIDSLMEISELTVKLHRTFKENNEREWTNFTMIVDESGKFKVDFDYTDISKGEFLLDDRYTIWEYKTLGIQPSNSYSKNIIDKYLNSIK